MVDKQTDPSLFWYVCGREDMLEGRIENAEIDLGAILERIEAPDDVAKLCTEAAKNALSSQSAGRVKRDWLAEEELAGAEGDTAWGFYLRGQIDELTDMIQSEIYEELRNKLDRDGDEGSEDEEP